MFIRYNNTGKFWEYDTSGPQNGTGPWVKLQIDYSQIINTPPGYVLPSNVALKDQSNTFINPIQIINAANSEFRIIDSGQVANSRLFRIANLTSYLYLQATDDTVTLSQGYLRIARDGSIYCTANIKAETTFYEHGRSVPIGEWTQYVPTWHIYNGADALIGNGILVGNYTLVGKTCFYIVRLTIGSTTNIGASYWAFSLPLPVGGDATNVIGYGTIRQATGAVFPVHVIPAAYYYGIANSVGLVSTSGSGVSFVYYALPFTWAVSDALWFSGFYQIQ